MYVFKTSRQRRQYDFNLQWTWYEYFLYLKAIRISSCLFIFAVLNGDSCAFVFFLIFHVLFLLHIKACKISIHLTARWFGLQLADLKSLLRKRMKNYLRNQNRCKNEQSLFSLHCTVLLFPLFSSVVLLKQIKSVNVCFSGLTLSVSL